MLDMYNNFEKQEKAGVNTKKHYQFGSNCCIGCKVDRPLSAEGMWCDGCKNFQNIHTNITNEISTEPNVDRQNNIIIGIAIGVAIMICAGLLVIMVMNS